MWKTAIGSVIAALTPYLAKKGIVVPPELSGYIVSLVVLATGIVSNGVKLGFADTRTTVTGIISSLVILVGTIGFQIDPDTQAALVGIVIFAIGLFSRNNNSQERVVR